jgi:hypothetical protein
MKTLFLIAGIVSLSTSALALDVGIGIGHGQNSGSIYVPIEFSPSLRIEPFLSVLKETSTTSSFSSSYSDKAYGAGLFGVRQTTENTRFFYGARLAYAKREHEQVVSPSLGLSQNSSASGYSFAPTVGFEYLLQKNISIGGEATISYLRMTDKSSYGIQPDSSTKQTRTQTGTSVTARYYFD